MAVKLTQPAFTLLELLVVITIMGILVSLVILDFAGVRERQELYRLGDQALALLQDARLEVSSGKVDEDGDFLCEGAWFENGMAVEWAAAKYDAAAQSCTVSDAVLKPFGFESENASTGVVLVGGAEVSSLYVLYAPPSGQIRLFSASGDELDGDLIVTFVHSQLDRVLYLNLTSATGLVTLELDESNE